MILADFLKAAVPDPVTCLGIRLRPLSLGALLLLYRFENAFIMRPSKPGQWLNLAEYPLGDLLQGILVCSQEFDQAQATLADPGLKKDMAAWGRQLEGPIWTRHTRAGKIRFQTRLRRASEIFAAFIHRGRQYPCTKAEVGPEKEIGSPWPLLTLTALMGELNQDLTTAINQPLALSRWLVAGNGERQALLEVVERSEVASMQADADAIAREVFGETGGA